MTEPTDWLNAFRSSAHIEIICQKLCTHTLYSFCQKFIYIFSHSFSIIMDVFIVSVAYSFPLAHSSSQVHNFPTTMSILLSVCAFISVTVSLRCSRSHSLTQASKQANPTKNAYAPFSQFTSCKLFTIIFLFWRSLADSLVYILSFLKWFLVWIICVCMCVSEWVRMHVYGWTTAWESLNSHNMPMSTKTKTNTDRDSAANSK